MKIIKKIPTFVKFILILFLGISLLIFLYLKVYKPYNMKQNGYIKVTTFDCPSQYPIKGNLKSKIYHIPRSVYYSKTNAANGYCFDTIENAKKQKFREPFNK